MKAEMMKRNNNLLTEEAVLFRHSEQIKFGQNCIVKKGAILDGKSEVYEYGIELGNNIEISEYAYLHAVVGKIDIKDNVFIGPFSLIYGQGGVFIGEDTLISGHTTIVAADHTFFDSLDRSKLLYFRWCHHWR